MPLECGVCLGRYSEPGQLPCGHSFCGACLCTILSGASSSRLCPACRSPAVRSTPNFALADAVEETGRLETEVEAARRERDEAKARAAHWQERCRRKEAEAEAEAPRAKAAAVQARPLRSLRSDFDGQAEGAKARAARQPQSAERKGAGKESEAEMKRLQEEEDRKLAELLQELSLVEPVGQPSTIWSDVVTKGLRGEGQTSTEMGRPGRGHRPAETRPEGQLASDARRPWKAVLLGHTRRPSNPTAKPGGPSTLHFTSCPSECANTSEHRCELCGWAVPERRFEAHCPLNCARNCSNICHCPVRDEAIAALERHIAVRST